MTNRKLSEEMRAGADRCGEEFRRTATRLEYRRNADVARYVPNARADACVGWGGAMSATLTPRDVLERRLRADQRNVAYIHAHGYSRSADVIADCAARLVEAHDTEPDLEPWAWRNLRAALDGWRE